MGDKQQFVYILTNTNRQNFKIGLTDDLNYTVQYYKQRQAQSINKHQDAARLVYFEEISQDRALSRLCEIDAYTRSQKERLIRRDNTNWIDLSLRLDMHRLSNTYRKLNVAS